MSGGEVVGHGLIPKRRHGRDASLFLLFSLLLFMALGVIMDVSLSSGFVSLSRIHILVPRTKSCYLEVCSPGQFAFFFPLSIIRSLVAVDL